MLEFGDVLLTGFARDGGLFVPESWPALPRRISRITSYVDVAVEVIVAVSRADVGHD